LIAWYESIAAQGIKSTLACFVLMTLFGGILHMVVLVAPQAITIAFALSLPILGAFSLRPFPAEQPAPCEDTRHSFARLLKSAPLSLLAVVLLISFSFGIVLTLGLSQDSLQETMGDIVSGISVQILVMLLALLIAYCSYRSNAAIAFYVAIPCILVASLLLSAGLDSFDFVLLSIVKVGSETVRFIVILLLVESILDKRVLAFFAFGLLSTAQFSGYLMGQILSMGLGDNRMMLALILMASLVLATLLVFMARESLRPAIKAVDKDDSVIDALALSKRLSPREREVLTLWVSGHNSTFIERKLYISKSTVKTHLAHIYTKTDTKNKEELLQLLETLQDLETS
jgi:DNA-binding CsgD family transcriptional regulator